MSVLDPGKLHFHQVQNAARFEVDLKKITQVKQDTFYRLAPLDTWDIFVQSDQIPIG